MSKLKKKTSQLSDALADNGSESSSESEDENPRNGSNDGSSSSSSSSSESDESNILETKLYKLRKLFEKIKSDLQDAQRKYAKIERALQKAKQEDNKVNFKKCKKYQVKYENKIEKLKRKQELVKSKIAKLKNSLDQKPNTGNDESETVTSSANKKLRLSPSVQIRNEPKQTTNPVDTKPNLIKIPYPVLNDKRDMNLILVTLETKLNELVKKREGNKKNIELLNKMTTNTEMNTRNLDKLLQHDQVLLSQQEKLLKQINYVKLSINLDALKNRANYQDALLISKMSQDLNDLYNFMKNENKLVLKNQQQKHQEVSDRPTSELLNQSNNTSIATKPIETNSKEKLDNLNEQLNKALVSLLAHTAASAHAAAAINTYNYIYYSQKNTLEKTEKDSSQETKLALPSKTEIEKATFTFSQLKDKISNFLISSKKEPIKPVKKMAQKNEQQTAIVSYTDEEEESEDEEINPSLDKKDKKEEKKLDYSTDDQSDESDVDELVCDIKEYDDVEIITTSEARIFPNRNYLLPSLKATYFPLKASLNQYENNAEERIKSNFSIGSFRSAVHKHILYG